MTSLVKTILNFENKIQALKFHLLAISTEEGIKLSLADIEVAVEIYAYGYDQDLFKKCVSKGYFKSEQSVRNSVAKLTKSGILKKRRGERKVEDKYLPQPKESDFIFNYHVKYDTKEL